MDNVKGLELNKIYNESNLETMAKMPDCFIDLTVTSPPYDGLRDYHGYSFPFQEICRELYRITKNGGVIVWVVGDSVVNGSETGTSFRQALYFMECGFSLHDTMIYKKENYLPLNHNRYDPEFEYMFIFSKGKPKTFNPIKIPCKTAGANYNYASRNSASSKEKNGALRQRDKLYITNDKKLKGNIWSYSTGKNKGTKDSIAFLHPATFPEALVKDHLYSWSNDGELIYDPFMGSGTTAKMSVLLNRKFIGSEISEKYVEIANTRLQQNFATDMFVSL